ncbi:MAG TPA: hypothetical protein VJ438_05360 [Candidatus Nanoarchaeia archaeon]|nr:hypothetical protein [Candidatus Nanoarchaeia archaeon]
MGINKNELKEIINDLIIVIKSVGKEVDFNIIFQEACSYQRGLMANQSKKDFFQSKQNQKIPITEAQEKFIKLNEKKLREKGFDINNIQSKEDAFKIIKAFKELG